MVRCSLLPSVVNGQAAACFHQWLMVNETVAERGGVGGGGGDDRGTVAKEEEKPGRETVTERDRYIHRKTEETVGMF